MAKAVKKSIAQVADRDALKARRVPYWHKLSTGCHLGFRKMSPSSAGTWLAQAYDPATKKQTRRSLGSFDDLPNHQRFDAAKKKAEAWFEHLGRGGSKDTLTVKQACEAYVTQMRTDTGDDAADDIDARFKRWVYKNKIAAIELPKLQKRHVDAWRQGLAKTKVIVNPHAEEPTTRDRSASSVNRDMTALRAALNWAHDHSHVTNDAAWRVALKPIKNAEHRRNVYLDRKQRATLIEKAAQDAALFLRGLSLLPLRPGALASLTVGNFDKKLEVLTIGKDKAGQDRQIKLPPQTAAFFAEQVKDKLPAAPLLSRADGKAWDKDAWKVPVKEAAKAADLPATVTAYSLRHSTITDLVVGGLDILTVARISGTSIQMIEQHYGHLNAEVASEALAKLAG